MGCAVDRAESSNHRSAPKAVPSNGVGRRVRGVRALAHHRPRALLALLVLALMGLAGGGPAWAETAALRAGQPQSATLSQAARAPEGGELARALARLEIPFIPNRGPSRCHRGHAFAQSSCARDREA